MTFRPTLTQISALEILNQPIQAQARGAVAAAGVSACEGPSGLCALEVQLLAPPAQPGTPSWSGAAWPPSSGREAARRAVTGMAWAPLSGKALGQPWLGGVRWHGSCPWAVG